jgi:proline iminopeptidase
VVQRLREEIHQPLDDLLSRFGLASHKPVLYRRFWAEYRGLVDEPFEVQVEGGALRGHRNGTGRPALLLHGGPAAPDYMAECAAALDGWFSTIRYTQRGTPPSDAPPPYTIESHVADALAVLDAFQLERAWAIGHSWGGHLALHLLVAHPERLDGVLCIGGLGADREVQQELTEKLSAHLTDTELKQVEEAEQHRRDGVATEAELVERWRIMWPHYFVHKEAAIPSPGRLNPQASRDANASITEHFDRGTLACGLPSARLPALFVHGAEDPLPQRAATGTAALIPGALVEIVPDSGHFPWLEQPHAFKAAVERLLGPAD